MKVIYLPTHQKATGLSVNEWFPGFRCGVPLPAQAGKESTRRNQVRCHALARGASLTTIYCSEF
jgi:hypothetical protein